MVVRRGGRPGARMPDEVGSRPIQTDQEDRAPHSQVGDLVAQRIDACAPYAGEEDEHVSVRHSTNGFRVWDALEDRDLDVSVVMRIGHNAGAGAR